jgi:alanyl-tRNA synthetase
MTSSAIRQSFLDFFREKGHTIVPSSPLLPDAPHLLFTNAGMNQFVPIFLGQTPAPQPPRAADTQKCIRAGGKHNDLEDVGFDTYHHTFFEMLGNWSFGDYFKKEAISWAWELVVGRWNFPASRIYATVYQPGPGDPAGFDQEAHDNWAAIFTAARLDPAIHIVNGNKKDNFWMMGDTGPCGPCSELHVDLTPGPRDLDLARQKEGRELVNKGDARCIEIWNLVFIQFNANPDGSFVELPAKHVDTGMGFERVVSMIQGTRGLTDFSGGENVKISNYETDIFRPIFDELEKLTGKKYGSTLPASAQNETEQEKVDVAFRVIADHIRTLSFSIADGIQPSNEGRGYVLRRILRRAVRYGRNLGLREPFLGKLVAVLGVTMGPIFPEVVAKADLIRKTLTNEEESFFRTLERGIELFESVIFQKRNVLGEAIKSLPESELARSLAGMQNIFSGAQAFKLYDTYGFPLDLTELMARERGMTVDVARFDQLMEEQKARGRAAQKKDLIIVDDFPGGKTVATEFVGFEKLSVKTVLQGEDRFGKADSRMDVFIVPETPFYVAKGGQVGDTGVLVYEEKEIEVTDVTLGGSGLVYHKVKGMFPLKDGVEVILNVDAPRRARIEAHHSATHLLNWALRKVLGNTITQKGSYVGPDRLRFDFSHGAALTPQELAEVEKLVNEKIEQDVPVTWDERPYAQVKGDLSILQFFGDKYGDTVRVVSIGEFSRELCGGTHVRHSAQVGYFKILHESAIAAGIRRIEAVSGDALRAHLKDLLDKQDEQLAHAKVAGAGPAPVGSVPREECTGAGPAPATSEISTLPDLWQLYKDREKLLHDLAAQRAQHEKETMKQQESAFQKQAAAEAAELIIESPKIGDIPFIVHLVDYQPAAYLPFLADALKKHWEGVALLVAIDEGKVALLCSVSAPWTKKIQAGKIIQAIAPLVGGKGGGRPELAQGGGTNPEGVTAALEKAEEMLEAIR